MSDSILHHHQQPQDNSIGRLKIALALSILFACIEVAGAYASNSLAILSDALHLSADVGSLLLALLAAQLSKRPATDRYTFGYHRAELLAALLSISILWVMTALLLSQAIHRLSNPQPLLSTSIMLAVATLGVLVNLAMAFILQHNHHHHQHQNLNVKAAYLHVLGDLLQSFGVLLAATLIHFSPSWAIIDPLTTIYFACIVLSGTLILAKEIVPVLMQASPIEKGKVRDALLTIPGFDRVVKLNIWELVPGKLVLSTKVYADKRTTSSTLLQDAQHLLQSQFGITDSTIEITYT